MTINRRFDCGLTGLAYNDFARYGSLLSVKAFGHRGFEDRDHRFHHLQSSPSGRYWHRYFRYVRSQQRRQAFLNTPGCQR
jgi:hypothetical protein